MLPPPSLRACLREEDGQGGVLAVLLDKHLKVLVDGRHREQDAGARADGAEELTQETMPEYGEVTSSKRKANAALASSSRSRAKSRKETKSK